MTQSFHTTGKRGSRTQKSHAWLKFITLLEIVKRVQHGSLLSN